MSNEMHETVADIMSEMRKCADRMEKHLLYDLRECATDYLRVLADRIEAAKKREREAGAEAAQICGEIGEIVWREAARQESLQDCNAAAMREALEKVRFYLPYFLQYMRLHREDAEGGGYYEKILEVVNAALSAPPRNCDLLSDTQEALAAIHEDRCYVNNPIDERRLTLEWLFDKAKGGVK